MSFGRAFYVLREENIDNARPYFMKTNMPFFISRLGMTVSSLGMTISSLEMDSTLVMVGKASVVFVFL